MVDLRVAPAVRGQAFNITVNGTLLVAYSGETVAGALLAAGVKTFRKTDETGPQLGGIHRTSMLDMHSRISYE
ncbi:MAG: 2Fe-2S iron-sulfur cluster-binding protein [Bosea sp. (in: a-proteobacteria)]|jgi:hypothetical protein